MIKTFQRILAGLPAVLTVVLGAVASYAQRPRIAIEEKRAADAVSPVWYVVIAILLIILAGMVSEILRRKRAAREADRLAAKRRELVRSEEGTINLDRELNWAKKRSAAAAETAKSRIRKRAARKAEARPAKPKPEPAKSVPEPALLPVFGLRRIERARPFRPLEDSADELLIDAIEQSNDELEPDPVVRDLALRILARYRCSNAIEALASVAAYDLSSSLRAKAVTMLAEMDHETVFEPLVMACADGAREVRAAAAKGLFRVTFDRTEAWLRVLESDDPARLNLIAGAVVSGDLVTRSVERLVHRERYVASEAVALTALLLRAGETTEIFGLLTSADRDLLLKKAIIHTIGISDAPEAAAELAQLFDEGRIDPSLEEEVDTAVSPFEAVAY